MAPLWLEYLFHLYVVMATFYYWRSVPWYFRGLRHVYFMNCSLNISFTSLRYDISPKSGPVCHQKMSYFRRHYDNCLSLPLSLPVLSFWQYSLVATFRLCRYETPQVSSLLPTSIYIRFTHCHLRGRSLVSAMLGVWLTHLSPFHLRISRKNSSFYFWLCFMDRKVAYLPSVVLYSDEKACLFDRLELQFHQYNISLLKEIENKLFNSMWDHVTKSWVKILTYCGQMVKYGVISYTEIKFGVTSDTEIKFSFCFMRKSLILTTIHDTSKKKKNHTNKRNNESGGVYDVVTSFWWRFILVPRSNSTKQRWLRAVAGSVFWHI